MLTLDLKQMALLRALMKNAMLSDVLDDTDRSEVSAIHDKFHREIEGAKDDPQWPNVPAWYVVQNP